MENDKIEAMLAKGRTIRQTLANFEIRESEDPANTQMVVEGYASTFNQIYELGRYYDSWDGVDVIIQEQVDKNAFSEADLSDVCFYYNHHDPVLARHKGKSTDTLQLFVDEKGLKVNADLSRSADGGKCYTNIKNDLIDQMSFAFTVSEDKRTVTEDKENHVVTILRTITKISKVYDVSAVDFPANDGTDIYARNFCDGVIEEFKTERSKARKEAREKLALKIKLMEV